MKNAYTSSRRYMLLGSGDSTAEVKKDCHLYPRGKLLDLLRQKSETTSFVFLVKKFSRCARRRHAAPQVRPVR